MISLPEQFENRMREYLGEEYEIFLSSYDTPRATGLRFNPLIIDKVGFLALCEKEFKLEPIPWCDTGFFYDADTRPGKNVYHEGGLYYIQEPSAMSVVTIADIHPGEKVLDLCAAPGGKSTQIAGKLNGQGLLVCNEIVPNRAKILSSNIERMGVKNAVVTNMDPHDLVDHFRGFFDKIIVDAPCSGEGMFNKEPEAIPNWSLDNVNMCAARQRDILTCAYEMLKSGGELVYSTCTFAKEEDEINARWFSEEFSDIDIIPIDVEGLMLSKGFDDIASGTARIWPHKSRGEGHFVAHFKKKSISNLEADFFDDCKTKIIEFGENIYEVPDIMPSLKGLKVIRPGLHISTKLKNREEPAHALAMSLKSGEGDYTYVETDTPKKYINGEQITCSSDIKGFVVVTYKGITLGWGKASGGNVKNHYPKGLRRSL